MSFKHPHGDRLVTNDVRATMLHDVSLEKLRVLIELFNFLALNHISIVFVR